MLVRADLRPRIERAFLRVGSRAAPRRRMDMLNELSKRFGAFAVGLAFTTTLTSAPARADATVFGKPWLGNFPTIQEALDAAVHGDVVLVTPGIYPAFTLDNKGVTVLGTNPSNVNVAGPCEVRNLGPKRRAALINLLVVTPDNDSIPARPGLRLTNNSGIVWLQNSYFRGSRGDSSFGFPSSSGAGVEAENCEEVFASSCTLAGRDNPFVSGEWEITGGNGLDSVDSTFALYDCTLRGGIGSHESWPTGGHGGNGANIVGWGLIASGTSFIGGRGGGGDYIGCTTSGDGGDGLWISGAQARLLDSPLTAGLAGNFYTCTPGSDGQALVAVDGAVVTTLAGARRELSGPTQGTDNAQLALTVTGQPGDNVWLLSSSSNNFRHLTSPAGVAAVPWPLLLTVAPMGVIGASGVHMLNVPFGDFTDPAPGRVMYFQALCVDSTGRALLTGPLQILLANT
jgi:hypothetical protein